MILGVDPGLSGALALYDESYALVVDIPTIKLKSNKSLKRTVDIYQLGNWLDIRRNQISKCVIEDVHAMPKQGVTSSFNFGKTFGTILGAVAANQIPMVLVPPQIWKKAFGLIGQDKDASRMAASRLAPQHAHYWSLAKHDGRAESFLLAVYGSRL